jgi:hypothetical protein
MEEIASGRLASLCHSSKATATGCARNVRLGAARCMEQVGPRLLAKRGKGSGAY